MMRLWREEYSRPVRRGPSTVMSVAVHGLLIFLAVIATKAPAGLVSLFELANRVYYVAPPNRSVAAPASTEKLKYEEAAPVGAGSGFARSQVPTDEATNRLVAFKPGDLGTDLIAIPDSKPNTGADSIFTVVEVDSAVTTDPTSAVPEYPDDLRMLGIEGFVRVRYVVDSTGRADASSLEILRASRIEFAMAVKKALPGMHFVPAKMGPRHVRQLVEQDFNFKIERQKADSLAPAPKKKPPVSDRPVSAV
jgi:TonB family protein